MINYMRDVVVGDVGVGDVGVGGEGTLCKSKEVNQNIQDGEILD